MNTFNQEQSDKYCIFRCAGEAFAMPALAVRRVVPQARVTPIPLSTDTLVGLTKIQQEAMTLFSLNHFYHFPETLSDEEKKVLVVNRDTGPWGLTIDEVEILADLEVSICPAQSSFNDQGHFVVGSATYRDEFVSIIDPEKLYSLLTGQLDSHWNEATDGDHLEGMAAVSDKINSESS